MAGAPPSTFRLPSTHFNKQLITNILNIWFADLQPGSKIYRDAERSRWFGMSTTADQRRAFDDHLRNSFSETLAAISPAKLVLPPFKSAADDRRNAALLCRPLRRLDILRKDVASDEDRARTGLGLVILLDQIPRNLFRSDDTKGVVFSHYDRIALALAHCVVTTTPTNALDAATEFPAPPEEEAELADVAGLHMLPFFDRSWLWQSWFYLPFEHSEDLADHEVLDSGLEEHIAVVEKEGDPELLKFPREQEKFELKHRVILEKFGRYPHRNPCLGRTTTQEEQAFLDGGGDTFSQ